jgi:hypothetical protein
VEAGKVYQQGKTGVKARHTLVYIYIDIDKAMPGRTVCTYPHIYVPVAGPRYACV